jgi:hypothetical protein
MKYCIQRISCFTQVRRILLFPRATCFDLYLARRKHLKSGFLLVFIRCVMCSWKFNQETLFWFNICLSFGTGASGNFYRCSSICHLGTSCKWKPCPYLRGDRTRCKEWRKCSVTPKLTAQSLLTGTWRKCLGCEQWQSGPTGNIHHWLSYWPSSGCGGQYAEQ